MKKFFVLLLSLLSSHILVIAKRNPYKILNVPKNALEKEIKKKYRELSKIYHPDRNKANEQKFKDIVWANQVLTNSTLRKAFDMGGEEGVNNVENGGAGFSRSHHNPFSGQHFFKQNGKSSYFQTFYSDFPPNSFEGFYGQKFPFDGFVKQNQFNQNRKQQKSTIEKIIFEHKNITYIVNDLTKDKFSHSLMSVLYVYFNDSNESITRARFITAVSTKLSQYLNFIVLNCVSIRNICRKLKQQYAKNAIDIIALATWEKELKLNYVYNQSITSESFGKWISQHLYDVPALTKINKLLLKQIDHKKPIVFVLRKKTVNYINIICLVSTLSSIKRNINIFDITSNCNSLSSFYKNCYYNEIVKILPEFKNDSSELFLLHIADIGNINKNNIDYIDITNTDITKTYYIIRNWIEDKQNRKGLYSNKFEFTYSHLTTGICGSSDPLICFIYFGLPDDDKFNEIIKLFNTNQLNNIRLYYANHKSYKQFCDKHKIADKTSILIRGKRNKFIPLALGEESKVFDVSLDSSIFNTDGLTGKFGDM